MSANDFIGISTWRPAHRHKVTFFSGDADFLTLAKNAI